MHAVAREPSSLADSLTRPELVPRLAAEDRDEVDGKPSPRERPLVLVVDDEASIRLLCRVNLRLEGMETLEAPDGETALGLAREHRPDLILLDVMMPHVDGWQVAGELTHDEATRTIPIVFLSAKAEPADHLRGYELGAVGYVTKPFDPTGLGYELNEILLRVGRGEREALRQERLQELAHHKN